MIAAERAETNKCRKLATEWADEVKVAKADVALNSALCEPAREEMDAKATKMVVLLEQLAGRAAELLQLSAKHAKLVVEQSRIKLHSVAGSAVFNSIV